MKVDLPSVIIGICALATFFVPIAWYHISEKIKVKKLTEELTQFAQEEKITLSSHEVWGDCYALGIDQKNKILLYFKQDEKNEKKIKIDLSEVENCKVSNDTRTIRNPKGNTSVINNIRLLFHYRTPKKGASLEIYDGENGKTLTSEISIANKWARTINSMLKTISGTQKGTRLL